MLDLGEYLLDRIEVRRVGWQEREPGACGEVEDDDVARSKLRWASTTQGR
jgi:hypothetical protein